MYYITLFYVARLNIVRLYLNGERVGYLSSNQKNKNEDIEMSLFPPARIHTAQEELCEYLGEGKNNSFILQVFYLFN